MSRISFLMVLHLCALTLIAQQQPQPFREYGELLKVCLSTAPFPHPRRAQGHTYAKQFYSEAAHYSDSTVAIFIPRGFRPVETVDVIVHIHGWRNNVDTVLRRYHLPQQLFESKKNAILVVPQGPLNAPDSFGGKLEDADGFKRFVNDVVAFLYKSGKTKSPSVGNVVLSGHSGAFQAMAYTLMRGGMAEKIREVYLFDALYGHTEKFAYWIDHFKGKMIAIYTDSGGTKDETEVLMEDLHAWHIPYVAADEAALPAGDLSRHRLLFLHTDLSHDMVLHARHQFREYLAASCFSDR